MIDFLPLFLYFGLHKTTSRKEPTKSVLLLPGREHDEILLLLLDVVHLPLAHPISVVSPIRRSCSASSILFLYGCLPLISLPQALPLPSQVIPLCITLPDGLLYVWETLGGAEPEAGQGDILGGKALPVAEEQLVPGPRGARLPP